MRVNIKIGNDVLRVVVEEGLDCEDGGVAMRRAVIVEPVKIMPESVHSVGAIVDSIWVKHRNDEKNETFPQKLRHRHHARRHRSDVKNGR